MLLAAHIDWLLVPLVGTVFYGVAVCAAVLTSYAIRYVTVCIWGRDTWGSLGVLLGGGLGAGIALTVGIHLTCHAVGDAIMAVPALGGTAWFVVGFAPLGFGIAAFRSRTGDRWPLRKQCPPT